MTKYLALTLAAIFMCLFVFGQPSVEDVKKALGEGAVSNVVKYFDKVVDITINSEQSTYSKSQAEMVLKKFFEKNPPKTFFLKHKGSAPSDNSLFVIGELHTAQTLYRTYLFFKVKDKVYYLQEIRLEQ